MPLSDEVRRELAAIEPQRDCDRLAELSGLFHTAGSLHLRGHGEFSVHLDLAESAVARRAFGLLRAFGVEAEIRTYRRRAFDRATRYQLHVPGRRALARACCTRPACSRPSHAPLEAPPKRVVGRACCRQRVPARGVPRRRLGQRPALAAPRDPDARAARAPSCSSRSPRRRTSRCASTTAGGTRSSTRRARRRSPTRSRWPAPGDAALALDEHAVVAEARARANRLANADHANLVRSSRAAHAQIAGDPRARGATGGWQRLAPRAARDRRAAAAPPVGLAARARREVPAAGDEGGGAPPARPGSSSSPGPIEHTRSFCRVNGSYSCAAGLRSSAGGFRPRLPARS